MDPPSRKKCTRLMIIAGHTLGTPSLDLAEALRLFKTAGLDAAEVIFQNDYPAAIRPSDKKSAKQAAMIAAAEGVPIVALTPYTTSINSLDATSWQDGIDEFRACIAAAYEVGATRVRVYAGAWQPGTDHHTAHWDQLRTALSTLAREAEPANVVLCVENHFGTMTQTAADTARLVREVDSPAVRVLYDQANLTFTHDENWQEAFAVQGDLIGHVHVKDLVFKDPHAPFRSSDTARVKAEERAISSRVVGTGVVPWRSILEELVRRGYDDLLTVEYEYRWHPQDLPDPAIGFRDSASVIRTILSEIASSR
jgi:L-ribulose-5-phosphate 3-epimerase